MSAIEWDVTGQRFYETGVDHGVLYLKSDPKDPSFFEKRSNIQTFISPPPAYGFAVPWNGLTAVNENPTGAEPTNHYADNVKYLTLMSAEDLAFTIEAFTYPPEFEVCEGRRSIVPGLSVGQQDRHMFGFSYRSKVGNDVDGESHGYKLHLYYGCLASPSSRNYNTVNENPEPINFSWEVSTNTVNIPNSNLKPTASITIDTSLMGEEDLKKLASLEKLLYGSEEKEAYLPLPDEIFKLFGASGFSSGGVMVPVSIDTDNEAARPTTRTGNK